MREVLRAGVDALGLALSDAQIDQLLAFQALLQKWNKVYNLTAVRDTQEMLTHHLLDSLAAVAPLHRHLAGQGGQRLLDVGSGGGLPGSGDVLADDVHREVQAVRREALDDGHDVVEGLAGDEPVDDLLGHRGRRDQASHPVAARRGENHGTQHGAPPTGTGQEQNSRLPTIWASRMCES